MAPKRKNESSDAAEPRRSARTAAPQAPAAPKSPKANKKSAKKAAQGDLKSNGDVQGSGQDNEKETDKSESEDKPEQKPSSNDSEAKTDDKLNDKQPADKIEDKNVDKTNARPEDQSEEPKAKKVKTGKINIGDHLTDITLKDDQDNAVSLLAESKDAGIVLFSYPAASTPGCTSQACSYRDHYAEIAKRGYKVFGISTDTVNAQAKFKTKNAFAYPLLSDPKKELLGALGGSTTSKKTALRCHWVFSAGGVLEAAEINVKPKDCVSKALASIDKIKAEKK